MLTYSSLGLSDHALLHVDIVDIYIVTAHVREWGEGRELREKKGETDRETWKGGGSWRKRKREKGREGARCERDRDRLS